MYNILMHMEMLGLVDIRAIPLHIAVLALAYKPTRCIQITWPAHLDTRIFIYVNVNTSVTYVYSSY